MSADDAAFLEDAAHYPGGFSAGVVCPRSEIELASILHAADTVLAVGAQSSLTGGATPMGELVLSLSKLSEIGPIGERRITAQPGVTLTALRERLAAAGKTYPPVPTFEGATVGGIVSTNAAGASTFKYGVTRDWVRALTVMLTCGELLDLERGETRATDVCFQIETSSRTINVSIPTYHMPDVAKHSAGYHATPDMDLIDLFIGSEGTLGVVTSVTLEVLPTRPEICLVLVALHDEAQAITLASRFRDASIATRHAADPRGLDVVSIEHVDHRSLELLREDGADRRVGVSVPDAARVVLLLQVELPAGLSAAAIHHQVGIAASAKSQNGPIVQLCRVLDEMGLLDQTELVTPDDVSRTAALLAFREAVPETVNRRVALAKHTIDDSIEKTAADMIVPFSKLHQSIDLFRTAFESRGLDYAIWGHLSDANLHPNVIPRSVTDVGRGREAILACGREIIRLGGCPLAEHGVGRNPTKQRLLRLLYGETGVDQMRRVKQALDPEWKLGPGVLFPPLSRQDG
ncbi:MAG: FAD-binding oxidoreductase [Acidobacteriota bacterium]|nr:FAD-binding oxidoreductase [Acidobacteriota bacterium]